MGVLRVKENGVWVDVTTAGPPGPTGPAGATGSQGPAGATGSTGTQGPQGTTGAQGPAGSTGAQGPQGIQGPQGPAGVDGPLGVVWRFDISTLPVADRQIAAGEVNQIFFTLPVPMTLGRWYSWKFCGVIYFQNVNAGMSMTMRQNGYDVPPSSPGRLITMYGHTTIAGWTDMRHCWSPSFPAPSASVQFQPWFERTIGTGEVTIKTADGPAFFELIDMGVGPPPVAAALPGPDRPDLPDVPQPK